MRKEKDQSTLLVSCLQGGFGDQLLTAWLIPRLWRYSDLPAAVAVLPANRPLWVRQALAGFHVWQMSQYWPPDDLSEIEKYDRLVSAAARSFGVSHVEALGPNQIPTKGIWSRCDVDLYARLASLACEGVYPQCPVANADSAEVDRWLAQRGLCKHSRLVVVHARFDSVYSYKNPRASTIRDLLVLIISELPVNVVLLGKTEDYVGVANDRCLVCSESVPLTLLAGILSRAFAFVGSDSGPRHLAGMTGTQIVTFDLPSDRNSGPFVPSQRVHRVAAVPDSDCGSGPFDFEPCQVADALARILPVSSGLAL